MKLEIGEDVVLKVHEADRVPCPHCGKDVWLNMEMLALVEKVPRWADDGPQMDKNGNNRN